MKVNTAIMGNWWPAKGRGLIFGLWTCHQYIGDIVAALAAGFLLHSGFDYRWYSAEPYHLYQCHHRFHYQHQYQLCGLFHKTTFTYQSFCAAHS